MSSDQTRTGTDLLTDPDLLVPAVPAATTGVAWLRSQVARFSEGADHRRRRALAERVLDRVGTDRLRRPGDPVATLARAAGLARDGEAHLLARDVRTVAAAYQPHAAPAPTTRQDAALERLVDDAGGRHDEATAALIGVLVQSAAATDALLAGHRPPVAATRRVAPDGSVLVVALDEAPFGAGRHACPGQAQAEALVEGASAFHRLHDGPRPLLLPNAWDAASGAAFAAAGFAAVGTTSLGVAAALGVPDASGRTRDATVALAAALADLPVPVTVDVEHGLGEDPGELAARLWALGVAGVNVEDGRGEGLADPVEQAAVVAAMKASAPGLFVNARTDTHWLGTDRGSTADRLRRWADAGADGVFVPGLVDEQGIAAVVAAVDVPVNVLACLTLDRLADLGVRRVSTGSLPYRAALGAAVGVATTFRDGADAGALATGAPAYPAVERLLEVRRAGTHGSPAPRIG